MSQTTAALVAFSIALGFTVLFLFIIALRNRPPAHCPRCGRPMVPGQTQCPVCGTPYPRVITPSRRKLTPVPANLPRLIEVEGPNQGRELSIPTQGVTIGRNPDSNILVPGTLVSRRHARIVVQGNQLLLQDLESTNGTYVNDQRVAQHVLQHGDIIQVGPSRFLFKSPGLPTPRPPEVGQPAADTPYLIGVDGRKYAIPTQGLTIGRATDTLLRLEGLMVSRHHARIRNELGQYIIEDLGSTNGTWVNGQRVNRHALQPGEQVDVGEFRFIFDLAAAPSQPVAVPGPPPPQISSAPGPARRVFPTWTGIPLDGYAVDGYTITKDLGGGGMARVYKAVDPQGQTVALKVLWSNDSYLQEKFVQEGQLRLDHPNIVRVYSHGHCNGRPYIVMEFMDGGSLRDRLPPGRPLPLSTVVFIAVQVCDGLHFAHQHGVIHRDVKPENILFNSAGVAKVGDFGIAKVTAAVSHTSAGMIIGTPYYLSYEQAQGEAVMPQSDVYSLGVVLYEMLTGYRPFEGEALTVVHKHLTEAPTPPRRRNSAILPEAETIVLRAMEKDASKRFKTALELSYALQQAVQKT